VTLCFKIHLFREVIPLLSFISHIIDWLYPPMCIACRTLLPINAPQRFICADCRKLFEPLPLSCSEETFYFTRNYPMFAYDEILRELLLDVKFNAKKRAAQGLGLLWAECLKDRLPENVSDFELVPMPMHKKKQRERGFNQAEIMAVPLAEVLGIPVSKVLIRTKNTLPQSQVHHSRRAENVKNVFALAPEITVKGKNYILADDIFTTGASLNECAKALKNAGAAKVLCITLAVSVKNNNKP
jgi:ComF family protein